MQVKGNLNIGSSSTLSGGTYLMSGGSITLSATSIINCGYRGKGLFNQTGGTVDLSSGTLIIGNDIGSGTYALGGTGALNVNTIGFGTLASSGGLPRAFNQSGGTLNAGTLTVPANASFIRSGGVTSIGTIFLTGGTLASSASGVSTFTSNVSVSSGSALQVDNGELVLAGPLVTGGAWSKTGAGTLTLTGLQIHTAGSIFTAAAGTTNLNVNDAGGSLTINANAAMNFGSTQHLTALNIGSASTSQVTPGGSKVLVTRSLTLDGGTSPTVKLDLNDNKLIVNYTAPDPSPLATIQAQIASAYTAGTWGGNGITSSAAAAAATSPHKTAIGYVEASAAGYSGGTFAGEPVDNDMVLARYTFSGDADINGTVDLTDFTYLAGNFNGTGKTWLQGDFNYDGIVDLTDFTFLASNFNQSMPASTLGAAVPEPIGVLAAGSFCAMAVCRRRRRR